MHGDLSIFTKGAQLLARLQRIPATMALDVTAKELDDIMLPPQADPLVTMSAEEKVEWLHSRLPFPCDLTYSLEKNRWRFWRRDES